MTPEVITVIALAGVVPALVRLISTLLRTQLLRRDKNVSVIIKSDGQQVTVHLDNPEQVEQLLTEMLGDSPPAGETVANPPPEPK